MVRAWLTEIMDGIAASEIYPTSSEAHLKEHFTGKHLKDVACPVAVIDAAVARKNCRLMLEAIRALDLTFRAHVKTHKVSRSFVVRFPNQLGSLLRGVVLPRSRCAIIRLPCPIASIFESHVVKSDAEPAHSDSRGR